MKAELMNPFVNALSDCVETITGDQPSRQVPFLKSGSKTTGDLTGVVSFVDKGMMGSIALSFPIATILTIFNKIMRAEESHITEDLQDFTAEFAGMVGEGAKRGFSEMGLTYRTSLPYCITGMDLTIQPQVNTPVIVVPFTYNDSPFTQEFTLKVG